MQNCGTRRGQNGQWQAPPSADFSGIGTHSFGNPIFYIVTDCGPWSCFSPLPRIPESDLDIPDDMRKLGRCLCVDGRHENIGTGTMLYKQGQHLVDIARFLLLV